MRSVWHSLLWKESRDAAGSWRRRGGLHRRARGCGSAEFELQNFYLAFTSSIVPYVILAGTFIGISITAGENSNRTAAFFTVAARGEFAGRAGKANRRRD